MITYQSCSAANTANRDFIGIAVHIVDFVQLVLSDKGVLQNELVSFTGNEKKIAGKILANIKHVNSVSQVGSLSTTNDAVRNIERPVVNMI